MVGASLDDVSINEIVLFDNIMVLIYVITHQTLAMCVTEW